jgi:hypothetical protein
MKSLWPCGFTHLLPAMLVAVATRPDSMNRAGKPVTVHAFPRATAIGMADATSPIPKAIKCAREPVTLDAYVLSADLPL